MGRNDEASRYELWLDGELASIADFEQEDGEVIFTHTETRDGYRGRGLAEQLVRHALEDVDARGLRPVPQCWFVSEVMGRFRTAS